MVKKISEILSIDKKSLNSFYKKGIKEITAVQKEISCMRILVTGRKIQAGRIIQAGR